MIMNRCTREMNAANGRTRQIRSDYCFVAIDLFVRPYCVNSRQPTLIIARVVVASDKARPKEEFRDFSLPTLRIAVSTISTGSNFESRHGIVREMFNDHIGRKDQDGNMAIDNIKKRTYPRNNFRNGPKPNRR